ncbi:hypothetical protein HK100_007393 [Physocladia obscura]|uniref:Uncharacterized protein n=1 Tax=Physocladia obscura TaxID=109957 RepID=A0AAD5T5R1_9FUNG|nr:hypothetical protein HK100_007393 [Physocladia obscura]
MSTNKETIAVVRNNLATMECEIDLKAANRPSGDDLDCRQQKFGKTIRAIQSIVMQKLYKETTGSLETYFKSVWKDLENFTRLPARERLCRTLKCLVRTRTELRILWAFTLNRLDGNTDLATCTFLTNLRVELIAANKLSSDENSTSSSSLSSWCPIGFTEESWSAYAEDEIYRLAGNWVSSRSSETTNQPESIRQLPPSSSPNWTRFHEPNSDATANFNCSTIEHLPRSDLNAIIQSLKIMHDQNHHLEYFVDACRGTSRYDFPVAAEPHQNLIGANRNVSEFHMESEDENETDQEFHDHEEFFSKQQQQASENSLCNLKDERSSWSNFAPEDFAAAALLQNL